MKLRLQISVYLLFSSLLLSSSCTRVSQPSSQIVIEIGPGQTQSSVSQQAVLSSSTSSSSPAWNTGLNPTSISQINCYSVFIGGPGQELSLNSCQSADGVEKFKFGPSVIFVTPGSQIELDVPSGDKRVIHLVGGVAQNGACQTTTANGAKPDFPNLSEPHVLASTTVDLSPGSQTISLSPVLDFSSKITNCNFYNNSDGGGSTDPNHKAKLTFAKAADIETDRFQVFANYSGDTNDNASYTLWYCNQTDSAGCDPLAGASAPMSKLSSSNLVFGEFTGLSSPNDAGDILKVLVQVNDPDGVDGPSSISDQFLMAQNVHRSVGTAASGALSTGGVNGTVSITGTMAQFSQPQPVNLGVGDAIQYDSNNDGSINSIAFIGFRVTDKIYVVKSATGDEPIATTSSTEGDWQIFRAYLSLKKSLEGDENTSIFSPIRDFDGVGDLNLTTLNQRRSIALYGSGVSDGAEADFAGWTTDPTNSIRIFSPHELYDVGTSQRHQGVLSTSLYRLGVTAIALDVHGTVKGLEVDGIQIIRTGATAAPAINIAGATSANIVIKNSIISGDGAPDGAGVFLGDGSYKGVVANNIISGFDGGTNAAGISAEGGSGSWYVYNNTVSGSRIGIKGSAQTRAINNLVKKAASGPAFNGTFHGNSNHNVTSDTAATGGGNDQVSQSILFVNEGSSDFHLTSGNSFLGMGSNLSSDPDFSILRDIDHQNRPTTGWDAGADQLTGI